MKFFIWIINSVLITGLGIIQISCIPSNYTISQEMELGLNPKMVGGQNASIYSARFMAAVFDRERFLCGATLISYQTLLTAATCTYRMIAVPLNGVTCTYNIQPYSPSDLVGTIGNLNRMEGHRIYFMEIRRHRDFIYSTLEDNIALLVLPEPITPHNDEIQPLPIGIDLIPRSECVVGSFYGWQPAGYGFRNTDILQMTQMHVLSSDMCNRRFLIHPDGIDEREKCVIPADNGRFVTGANIGGPLIYYVRGHEPTLLGILNRVNIGSSGIHVVSTLTKVSAYMSFIRRHIVGHQSQTNVRGGNNRIFS